MLKQRLITGMVLIALLLGALFVMPPIAWTVLVVVMVMLGISEWGRLSKLSAHGAIAYWWITFAVMAGMAGFGLTGTVRPTLLHLPLYALSVLFWIVLAPLWMMRGWHVRQPLAMALVGWMVLIPFGLAMIDLRAKSSWLVLGIMALVWIADTAAYFSGKKFGKHKLAPTISPGKTWEGVAGAVLVVSLYVVAAGYFSGQVHGFRNFILLTLISWVGVALSVTGDLFESAAKRQAGVKDSGALLPGHGGVLDRIDAMTSTLPAAAFALLVWAMI